MTQTNEQIRAAVAEQAAEFFIEHQAGFASDDDRRNFIAWLRQGPMQVEEYLAAASIAKHLPAVAAASDAALEDLIAAARREAGDTVAQLSAQAARYERAPRRPWAGWLRTLAVPVAAAATVLLAIATLYAERSNWLGVPLAYRTGHGERHTWPLPDGSTITLNADSALEVRYSLAGRSVEVSRGRALFEVAHERNRAFSVTAGPARVVAVGTRFDVDRLAGTTVVTVTEGRVLVSAPGHGGAAAGPGAGRSIGVGRGEQVRVDPDGGPLQAAPVDVRAAGAWLRGQIAFDQRPLGEVADEFNRYAAVPFEIEDPALRAVRISGVFGDADAESFEQFLKSLDDVAVERSATAVRVTRRAAAPRAAPDPRR